MTQKQFGTAARFGILKQTAFETPQTNDANFHYMAFTGGDFGPQQQQGELPPEAGGVTKSLPRGVFKTGVHAHGPEFSPAEIGWLMQQAVLWSLVGTIAGAGLGLLRLALGGEDA